MKFGVTINFLFWIRILILLMTHSFIEYKRKNCFRVFRRIKMYALILSHRKRDFCKFVKWNNLKIVQIDYICLFADEHLLFFYIFYLQSLFFIVQYIFCRIVMPKWSFFSHRILSNLNSNLAIRHDANYN